MDNQAYTDAGALLVPQVVFAPSVFAAETAFSSFAADRKVNWAYTDAGALFVPRVAFAPSVFFSAEKTFSSVTARRSKGQSGLHGCKPDRNHTLSKIPNYARPRNSMRSTSSSGIHGEKLWGYMHRTHVVRAIPCKKHTILALPEASPASRGLNMRLRSGLLAFMLTRCTSCNPGQDMHLTR
jgi:hypothetical protein